MTKKPTSVDLEAYLDEVLPAQKSAEVEDALRDQPELVEQLATLAGKRDAGVHSLGAIWRRQRLSCPSREQLGSFLLGVLDPGHADYVRFHLDEVGCRYCNASVEDLREQHAASNKDSETRRSKYFQSSAGYLSVDD